MTLPDGLELTRNRDLTGRERNPWARRTLLGVLIGVIAAGLFNQYGQEPETARASGPGVDLVVKAPDRVRGGLYFEVRYEIRAEEELRDALLVVGRGWLDGITVNTIEPSPLGEASRDGDLALRLGHVPAGERYVLWMQSQVNPTTIGRRNATVELYDGDELLATHARRLTILP